MGQKSLWAIETIGEIKKTSTMKAEREVERGDRVGDRRWTERRMVSYCREKGSLELTWVGSKGVRLKWMWVTWGKEEVKAEMRVDSARERVGLGVKRVTLQPWRRNNAASLRHGLRWPMPALVRKPTWTPASGTDIFCCVGSQNSKWLLLCDQGREEGS